MKICIAAFRILMLFSIAAQGYSQTQLLTNYTARYEASANGLAATATRSLENAGDNRYLLSNTLEASLAGQQLARLEQSSEFELDNQTVVPQNYSYQLSGVSRASNAIAYNWEANIAISSEDDRSWQLDLHEGVLDQLSYQVALRLTLINQAEQQPVYAFELIDGDEIDRHEYRVVGAESLDTPLGEIDALKLERIRAEDDDRRTEIWLAPEWEYLLARLVQVNSSGLRIELQLESAEIGEETVSGGN